jgi:hypothetical protein
MVCQKGLEKPIPFFFKFYCGPNYAFSIQNEWEVEVVFLLAKVLIRPP